MLLGSEDVGKGNIGSGQKKVVALRMTGKTFYDWTMQGQDIVHMPHWSTLTHVILENWLFDNEVGLIHGNVRSHQSLDGAEEFSNSVLMDLRTYRNILMRVRQEYPQLKFIWALPSTNNIDYWNVFVRRHGPSIVSAVNMYMTEDAVDGILADVDLLFNLTMPLIRRIQTMSWWVVYPHECTVPSSFVQDLREILEVEFWVLNSFGMLKRHRVPTSHGLNSWLEIHPEASIDGFEAAVSRFCDLTQFRIPYEQILMGMATTAVQYVRHPWHRDDAMLFEVRPMREIRHEIMFGTHPCHEKFDPKKGYSLLHFDKPRKSISYDNDAVRSLKFDQVFNGCYGGLVLGYPEMDETPNHPGSLLRQANERFKPYQLFAAASNIVPNGTAGIH